MKNYYSILGVPQTASEAEIKRAYRRLAVLYHPDKNKDPQAQETFVEITEAYDVVSDSLKRHAYDQLIDKPFSDTLVAEEQVKPTHRDPAYRRKRPDPNFQASKKFSDTYYLMKDYLKYFKWAGRIGLLVSFLFFVDYLLPYQTEEEKIQRIYEVRGRKNTTAYNVIVTEAGKKIKLYNGHAGAFFNQPSLVGEYTFFYSTPMKIYTTDGTYEVKLAYMYGGLMLFPMVLFVTSVLGILYKERIEFCFNANLVSGVLLILFLILI